MGEQPVEVGPGVVVLGVREERGVDEGDLGEGGLGGVVGADGHLGEEGESVVPAGGEDVVRSALMFGRVLHGIAVKTAIRLDRRFIVKEADTGREIPVSSQHILMRKHPNEGQISRAAAM